MLLCLLVWDLLNAYISMQADGTFQPYLYNNNVEKQNICYSLSLSSQVNFSPQ